MGSPTVTFFFFFNDTATTEIYTLSLHDALPISSMGECRCARCSCRTEREGRKGDRSAPLIAANCGLSRPNRSITDRKSTRLNSSHSQISYAVFCLKKKNNSLLPLDSVSTAETSR